MLIRLRARYNAHIEAWLRGFNGFIKKPIETLITVLIIAVTLTLPALFSVVGDNWKTLTDHWQQGGHLSLFLNVGVSPADETALLQQVQNTPGVAQAILKSAAESLADLQQQEGMQDVMQYLSENPLPATIDVIPTSAVNTAEKRYALHQQLKSYPHVEKAPLDKQWMKRFYAVLDTVDYIATGFILFLGLVVVFIIVNTLRLAIQSRHEEIEVLTLIGASYAYIIRPFLYLGLLYGFAGAFLAMVLVKLIAFSLMPSVNQLAQDFQLNDIVMGLSFEQDVLLLLSGSLLGWLAARYSVKSLSRLYLSHR